ncbi:MAG: response regulator [Flavobacteriales bacterium]|nr:response regulator [Flavobacteriales bacterium]
MKVTAIIIDDERLARKELRSLLELHSVIEIIDEAANADEALAKIHEKRPNLIFLDIQMPGKTGFDLLEELDYIPEVIFTTAYDEYALKAFEVNALDYLLKPIEEERLKDAIDKVVEKIELDDEPTSAAGILTENDQVFVKDGDKCWFVTLKDVRYFESVGNYVKVHFDSNRPMILKSLNNLEKKLDSKTFFRANRKHIINLRWIEKSETWFNGGLLVTVNGEETIEISRRQAAKLKDMMSL